MTLIALNTSKEQQVRDSTEGSGRGRQVQNIDVSHLCSCSFYRLAVGTSYLGIFWAEILVLQNKRCPRSKKTGRFGKIF